MFMERLKRTLKALYRSAVEEVRKFPHLALTTSLLVLATLWWLINRQTSTKRIVKIRSEQIDIEREYSKTMKEAVNMHENERKKITDHYQEELKKLSEIDKSIDEASDKGPIGIASAWAEYLGTKK